MISTSYGVRFLRRAFTRLTFEKRCLNACSCFVTSCVDRRAALQLVGGREQEALEVGGVAGAVARRVEDRGPLRGGEVVALQARERRRDLAPRPALGNDDGHDVRRRALGENRDHVAVAHVLLQHVAAGLQVARACRRSWPARRRRTSSRSRPCFSSSEPMSPTPDDFGIVTATRPEPSPWNGWNSDHRNQTAAMPQDRDREQNHAAATRSCSCAAPGPDRVAAARSARRCGAPRGRGARARVRPPIGHPARAVVPGSR